MKEKKPDPSIYLTAAKVFNTATKGCKKKKKKKIKITLFPRCLFVVKRYSKFCFAEAGGVSCRLLGGGG